METIYTMIARIYTGMYERDETEDVGAGLVEYTLIVALISHRGRSTIDASALGSAMSSRITTPTRF